MVTFAFATSFDNAFATEVRPVRAPVERPIGDIGVFTMAEVMFTMRPNRRSTMPGNTARIIAMGASMLASSAAIQVSRSQSAKRPGVGPPLLLTRMSGAGHAASNAACVSG